MDIISRLESDHRLFLMTAARLLSMAEEDSSDVSGGHAGEVMESLMRLKAGLARHEQIECRLLHPLVRSCHPGASVALADSENDHRSLERMMEEVIVGLADGSEGAALRRGLSDFNRLLRRHLFQEEASVFCLAERGVSARELMRLGEEADLLVSRQ